MGLLESYIRQFVIRSSERSIMLLSEEVIERFKAKIPLLNNFCDHTIYGITQMDILRTDGSVKQIVLVFERLLVVEPEIFITKDRIYADVYIKINDEVLIDIASKKISLDDALNEKMFQVFGDAEIWDLQLKTLKNILPNENFSPRPEEQPNDEPKDEATAEVDEDYVDFENLPQIDFSDVPKEFQFIVDQIIALLFGRQKILNCFRIKRFLNNTSISYSEANSKFDLDYDGDLPSRSPLEEKTKEDKILKEALVVGGCPLCDSSVYSYCDQKIYHDAFVACQQPNVSMQTVHTFMQIVARNINLSQNVAAIIHTGNFN
ncbi:CLUMA_CG016259, isoform A [Clunio marinus]|uniref:CLUMA_CG016259, isoform A n=1 Tax=Clunio marinus TaxID=568069 RepID=A0A1J1ITE1_9DIPT|nr:CLUMA_CG016259, isoform A [Clunio marinus]